MNKAFSLFSNNQGRIVIPQELRKLFSITPDTELLVFEENNCIKIMTRMQAILEAQQIIKKKILSSNISFVDTLRQIRVEENE